MAKTLIFGVHAVEAVLTQHPERIKVIHVAAGRQDRRMSTLLDLAGRHGLSIQEVAKQKLDTWTEGAVHQGVVAEVNAPDELTEHGLWDLLDNLKAQPFLLVLDGVTDPHNLGACLRSADAAGVHALVVPKDHSSPLTPAARKVACGAAESVPLVRVTNLARCLRELKERGAWIVGAAGEADRTVFEADFKGPLVLVMGAEGSGLRRLTREHCDVLVNIPMAGQVSSLNVSVATGICLFEAVRQRR